MDAVPVVSAEVVDPIGVRVLCGDNRRRIKAFARACSDPRVLAAVDA